MVKVFGHTLDIAWDELQIGSSFFIPCINREEVQLYLEAEAYRMRLDVVTKLTIENHGIGVRLWRISK